MLTSKQETQRQALLQLWNNGIRNAMEIHARTNIPLTTIYDNIRKLKKTGTLEHARGNGILISLVESMPRRCQLVIESNGERINY